MVIFLNQSSAQTIFFKLAGATITSVLNLRYLQLLDFYIIKQLLLYNTFNT